MKQERAITLIALIITIIVLLILAGVSIVMLPESGIFDKAKLAEEENEKATAKENLEIKILEYEMYAKENNKEATLEGFKEYLENDEEIEEFVLYYPKQAALTDSFQTTVNGKAVYAKIKLKKYKFRYTVDEELEIVEVDDTLLESDDKNKNSLNIDEDLKEYLDKYSIEVGLKDILISKPLMQQILNSEEAIEYILEDKECLEIIFNDENTKNLFFGNANVVQKIASKYTGHIISEPVGLVEQLKSNQGTSGVASCSSKYGDNWDAWIAFNNRNGGDGWYPRAAPAWVQYRFNTFRIVNKFSILPYAGFDNATPNLKLQYSYDGINWNDATEFRTYTLKKETTVELEESICAKYFRLYLTTGVRLYKFQVYGVEDTCIFKDVEYKNEKNKAEQIIKKANIQKIIMRDIVYSKDIMDKLQQNNCIVTVPKMKGPSQDGFKITSSSHYGDLWEGWRAFDADVTSSYTFYPVTSPGWVQVEFPKEVYVYKVYYSSINNVSTNYKILSSEDGINWVSRTGEEYVTLNVGGENILNEMVYAKYWRFETINHKQYYNLQFYALSND